MNVNAIKIYFTTNPSLAICTRTQNRLNQPSSHVCIRIIWMGPYHISDIETPNVGTEFVPLYAKVLWPLRTRLGYSVDIQEQKVLE